MIKQVSYTVLAGTALITLGAAALQYTGVINLWPDGTHEDMYPVIGIDDAKAGQVGALGRLDINELEVPAPEKVIRPKVQKKAAALRPVRSKLPSRHNQPDPNMTPVEDLPDNIPSHLPQPDAPVEVVDINKTLEISATNSDF